jgi:hypothetical protein
MDQELLRLSKRLVDELGLLRSFRSSPGGRWAQIQEDLQVLTERGSCNGLAGEFWNTAKGTCAKLPDNINGLISTANKTHDATKEHNLGSLPNPSGEPRFFQGQTKFVPLSRKKHKETAKTALAGKVAHDDAADSHSEVVDALHKAGFHDLSSMWDRMRQHHVDMSDAFASRSKEHRKHALHGPEAPEDCDTKSGDHWNTDSNTCAKLPEKLQEALRRIGRV